jgi:alkylated DNA repair dioxygenase AlkB
VRHSETGETNVGDRQNREMGQHCRHCLLVGLLSWRSKAVHQDEENVRRADARALNRSEHRGVLRGRRRGPKVLHSRERLVVGSVAVSDGEVDSGFPFAIPITVLENPFGTVHMEAIAIPGAEIYYERAFLSAEEGTALLNTLMNNCAWERRQASFGYPVPRDEAYYGDPETNYIYSRREYKPLPWIPELLSLRRRVEEATPTAAYANLGLPKLSYNAVLCNLYRSGIDSVGLHADAEPEMGPVIASLSLGVERLFRMKRVDGPTVFAERLPHGSLLIMAGETQKNFRHEAPKEPGVSGARINLTFRRIEHR